MFLINHSSKSIEDKTSSLLLILLASLIILLPKMNIISIPGFWQGIQIADLLIFIFFIYVIFNIANIKLNKSLPFTNLFYFSIYFLFASFVANFSSYNVSDVQRNVHGILSFNISIILILRLFEYLIFTILILNFCNSKNRILKLCKFFILLNFVFAFLQEFELVGYINSRGIYSPGDDRLGGRPMGLTGGPWELGSCTSISFFSIYLLDKKNFYQVIIFFFLTLFCLVLAETKGNLIAFIAAIVFLEGNLLSRILTILFSILLFLKIFIIPQITYVSLIYYSLSIFLFLILSRNIRKTFILSTFLFLSIILFNLAVEHFFFLQRLLKIDFIYLLKVLFDFFVNNNIPGRTTTPDVNLYYSFILRLEFWYPLLINFKSSYLNLIFGMGNTHLYYESFIFRCIFSFGIFGSLLIIYLSYKLPLFLLVYTFLAGLTFDLYFSSKVFFISNLFILSYYHYNNAKNQFK